MEINGTQATEVIKNVFSFANSSYLIKTDSICEPENYSGALIKNHRRF